jgi:hypothetical protein
MSNYFNNCAEYYVIWIKYLENIEFSVDIITKVYDSNSHGIISCNRKKSLTFYRFSYGNEVVKLYFIYLIAFAQYIK